ncbi:cation-transporting P-type ATPase [Candidatus Saccharibacteria bacterium]|nr:cation-transporting P-type ATPase [Candidatus Saccharibacteria bacterium]
MKTPDTTQYYQLSVAKSLEQLDSQDSGLTAKEATARLESNGPNQLADLHKESLFVKYLRQFQDLIIVLLIASAGISYFLGETQTAIALGIVIFLNTIMGFRQEFKAEKIMESLERLVVPITRVKRDGSLQECPSPDLVIGDVVYVEEGDSVPADIRLLSESELATNDFALTGESNPTRKTIEAINGEVLLGDRHNMLFMGTTVATGHGYGVVVATGMQTELGRIAGLSASTKSDTSPLQKEMNNVGKKVTQATVGIFLILLLIANGSNLEFEAAFLFAVAVAASLVPQGLPAAISTVLAQAANKMAGQRALVKKLSAVETLGATSIICTDKTGTLTKNQMTVEQLWIAGKTYHVTGTGYEPAGHITSSGKSLSTEELRSLELFFATGTLASNARIKAPDNDHPSWYCLGDPTEGALVTLAEKAKLDSEELEKLYPESKQFSFDSARKRMSSIRPYTDDNKSLHVFAKGAPENILERCTHIWEHGKVRTITAKDKTALLEQNEALAKQTMRNLAFAYKTIPATTKLDAIEQDDAESGLTLLGMVSMIDPLREEVIDAMKAAHKAHIRVSVVTGDYASTAQAIAKKAGLGISHEIVVVSGEELHAMDDKEVLRLATRGSVIFSRVSPEDKLRIVGLVKDSGKVVAVTGDGINDAPALKRADIGVAMGVTGTDVAKQSAEIVLLDDSFNTLIHAIQQGRNIFQNIKKITLVAFVANFSELVVNLASLIVVSLFSAPLALTVMLIIAIDLIAELFPMVALGWDKAEGQVMSEQPRNPKDHILNKKTLKTIIWAGSLIGLLAFANFAFFFWRAGLGFSEVAQGSSLQMQASTLTYVTIMLCQLVNILFMRSSKGLFTRYQLHNSKLLFAFGLSMASILAIVYVPFLQPYFGSAALTSTDWLTAAGAAGIFAVFRQLSYFKR